jgi:hypothetical protein
MDTRGEKKGGGEAWKRGHCLERREGEEETVVRNEDWRRQCDEGLGRGASRRGACETREPFGRVGRVKRGSCEAQLPEVDALSRRSKINETKCQNRRRKKTSQRPKPGERRRASPLDRPARRTGRVLEVDRVVSRFLTEGSGALRRRRWQCEARGKRAKSVMEKKRQS